MEYYVELTSDNKDVRFNFVELWKYRYLIFLLTRKTFTLSYKQTILGPLWLLFTPIIYSGIHSIVFGRIAGISTDGVPQFLYYLVSNSLWGMFASCINRNANVFRENQGLFGKVYFPRLTVPVSNIFVAVITFFVQVIPALLMIFITAIRGEIHPLWPAWPLVFLILAQLSLLGLSVGILVSSLTSKYRDFSVLVGIGVTIWMYLSPVIYPLSQLRSGWIRTMLLINPVTAPMELYRRILLGSGAVEPVFLVFSLMITVCFFFGSIAVFHRVEQNYMDTV